MHRVVCVCSCANWNYEDKLAWWKHANFEPNSRFWLKSFLLYDDVTPAPEPRPDQLSCVVVSVFHLNIFFTLITNKKSPFPFVHFYIILKLQFGDRANSVKGPQMAPNPHFGHPMQWNSSPGERVGGVEAVKESRVTGEGGALTHIHAGLTQWTQKNPQNRFWFPHSRGVTTEVLTMREQEHLVIFIVLAEQDRVDIQLFWS